MYATMQMCIFYIIEHNECVCVLWCVYAVCSSTSTYIFRVCICEWTASGSSDQQQQQVAPIKKQKQRKKCENYSFGRDKKKTKKNTETNCITALVK